VGVIGEAGRADAGAFLARLVRLDPAALVRLRPTGTGASPEASSGASPGAEMWAMLPFGVLVVRTLAVPVDGDVTVDASALLDGLGTGGSPRRRDEAWHWPLPSSRGRVVETIPAAELARVAEAASSTLRTAVGEGVGGRPVGERAVRDALLDHVPVVVTSEEGDRVEVPQRLVQAIVRMGFLGRSAVTLSDSSVTVRVAQAWVGLAAPYGSSWYRPSSPLRMSQGVDVAVGPFR
jgi:hypothetical protein